MKLSSLDLPTLLAATSYREFVRVYQSELKRQGLILGFSDIARRGGFASRSFPRDVILGEKRLTLQSLYKFSTGLGLKGDLAEYFHQLVQAESPECATKKISLDRRQLTLRNLRDRILRRGAIQVTENQAAIFELHQLPVVYSSLGDEKIGASIAEISKRSRLTQEVVAQSLRRLLALGLAEKKRDRYFALTSHLGLAELRENKVFQQFFLHLLAEAASAARKNFDSDQALFFTSSFSIQSRDLPNLKAELRSVLLKYVDHSEAPLGNKVASVVCAMF